MSKSKVFLTTCAIISLSLPAMADNHMKQAEADIVNTSGNVIGKVVATKAAKGTILRVEADKIPEGWHGLHIHQVGDCSDNTEGFKLSGSHVNPDGAEHGFHNEAGYEAGDLPNVHASKDGVVMAEMHSAILNLDEDLMDKDGAALVMHENADDMSTQPIGGAGKRIACAAFKDKN